MHMEGYITASEAAAALNCSVDTVRRRLRNKTLPGKQDAGGAWWVQADAVPVPENAAQMQADTVQAMQTQLEAAQQELESVRQQVAAALEGKAAAELAAAVAQEAVRRLEGHVADLREQNAGLQTALDQQQRLHAALQQRLALPEPKRPWWRFWRS